MFPILERAESRLLDRRINRNLGDFIKFGKSFRLLYTLSIIISVRGGDKFF